MVGALTLVYLIARGEPVQGPVKVTGSDSADTAPDTGADSGLDTGPFDADADGYTQRHDCADDNPDVHLDAVEVCDGADNDCDGLVDDADDDVSGGPTWYTDTDGDGFGGAEAALVACLQLEGTVATAEDCDDADASAFPGAVEACDWSDDDCDGVVDDGFGSAPQGERSLSDADSVLIGTDPAVMIGWVSAGDMDGDGQAEMAVTGTQWPYDTDCGLARIYLVGTPAMSEVDVEREARASVHGREFDGCISVKFDLEGDGDGDGGADLLTASYNGSGAYVFRGSLSGYLDLDDASLVVAPDLPSLQAGGWVGNVDGIPGSEIAVGSASWYQEHWEAPEGRMQIFSGATDGMLGPDDAVATITGGGGDTYVGNWFASAGDLDGDGLDELVVNGRWFFYGPVLGDLTTADAEIALASDTAVDQWMMTATRAGDIDGDGKDEALVGAWWGDGDDRETGGVFVSDADRGVVSVLDLSRRLTLGYDEHEVVGRGVAVGDVNGDGTPDAILGGGGPDGLEAEVPAIYVEYGPFTGVREMGSGGTLTAPPTLDYAGGGSALSPADINGDSFDDIFAGSNPADNDALGTAFLMLGGPAE
jgi:hypothetical protein